MEYYSKNVPEITYYSRFNFQDILIDGQRASVAMGILFGVAGIVAFVVALPTGGSSIMVWSILVGDFILSGAQLAISLEKNRDLNDGYAFTDPTAFGMNQEDVDQLSLLLLAAGITVAGKQGANKLLYVASDKEVLAEEKLAA
ncbi:hypothetical protein D3C78_1385500 [compost metagenome]